MEKEKYICKTPAHIHSLGGKMGEAKIIKKIGDNDYLAEYNGVKCHAIFNFFMGEYYVDDKYGVIQEQDRRRDESCR